MSLLGGINYGSYNLVTGGFPDVDLEGRNLIVGGGFPHLNAGRLGAALEQKYNRLHEVNSVTITTGQRPRWPDNVNEATSNVVFEQTAIHTGFDLNSHRDQRLLRLWKHRSRFAREHFALPEEKRFPTEAEMGVLALELAMLRAGDLAGEMFYWRDYSVIEHHDESLQDVHWAGGVVLAPQVAAYEYRTVNGNSFWVGNAPAQRRISPTGQETEPRPDSDGAARHAYQYAGEAWRTHESIIGTGAPQLRVGIDTAIRIAQMGEGNIKTLHLASGHWRNEREPAITGIANIVSTYKSDKRARALLAGQDPDSAKLRAI